MDAFNTVFMSPGKARVSMARATDVGGFSLLGGFAQPDIPTIR
jgi:hypothetical protein